ncbi:hypothetical protein [Methanocaldococcus villosus]|nr:hypothetical protein [Methanocaldococcus villosus]
MEFMHYFNNGKYDKVAKEIKRNPELLQELKKELDKGDKESLRRGLLVLKRLDNEIVKNFLYYVFLGLDSGNRFISKEAEFIIKKLVGKEVVEEAIVESYKYIDDRVLYYLIEHIDNPLYKKIILKYTNCDSLDKAILKIIDRKVLEILSENIYKNKCIVDILLKIVDKLGDEEKKILKEHLSPIILGKWDKNTYKKTKKLFYKLNVNYNLSEDCIINLLKNYKREALNLIVRENIRLSDECYSKILKTLLYSDEELQFIGVKLISLMDDSKKKVDFLFKFLSHGNGKAKTAAINELKKIIKTNKELADYIENKAICNIKIMNMSVKISSLRLLKEYSKKEYLDFLINEHKKIKNKIYQLDREKFKGGFRHLLFIEEEIRKCKIALNIIESIIAEICLKNRIHYKDLKIAEKLGYEFYKTIEIIGSKDLSLIDFDEFLEDVKKYCLITHLTEIIKNKYKNLDEEKAKKVIEIVENLNIHGDIYDANKIIIYALLGKKDKLGEILKLANNYQTYLAFIFAVKHFLKNKLLSDEEIKLLIPKIAEMLYNKRLRKEALKFFEEFPSKIAFPILISENIDDAVDVITKIILTYPELIYSLKERLYSNRRMVLKVLYNLSKYKREMLEDFIYILIILYNSSTYEERKLIKDIIKNVKPEYIKFL